MVKARRAIQQWEHWLMQPLGSYLLEAEKRFLHSFVSDCYGKHALLIGVPRQNILLKTAVIPHQVLVSPLINKNKGMFFVESEFVELAFATASIDLVILPHTLEYIDNPQHVLSEACRIVKPDGYIIILGFNPYSLWGLKKYWIGDHHSPWSGNFLPLMTIKKWLALADFELVKQSKTLYRPPLQHHLMLYKKLKFLEWLGHKFWSPLGGVYGLMAKAKVIPLTPIKLNWKQQPYGAQDTIPGQTIRNWQ